MQTQHENEIRLNVIRLLLEQGIPHEAVLQVAIPLAKWILTGDQSLPLNMAYKTKFFTTQDIVKTADNVMDIIKTKLDDTTDIADIVIFECSHRIMMERKLNFCNPAN